MDSQKIQKTVGALAPIKNRLFSVDAIQGNARIQPIESVPEVQHRQQIRAD